MNPEVDVYLSKAKSWQEETRALRMIMLDCGLIEEIKWGKPCYSFQQGNIAVLQGFKAYCAILFFKGMLLKDPEGILIKTGENTRVGRQIRFNNVQEIFGRENIWKAYILEAIEVEKAGLKVDLAADSELTFSEEFKRKLDQMPALESAFEALTPGRKRAYNIYFSAAKQSKTREARVEKCMPQILSGKGLDD